MGIPQLSKYIIIFLFAVLVVLSVMLGIYSAENKQLSKDNTRLKEKVLLQETAIKEIDVNIKLLKNQLQEAESICNDRLKARNDLLVFLKNEPFKDTDKKADIYPSLNEILHTGSETGAEGSTAPVFKQKVVSYEKSVVAIDYINSYWVQFTQPSNSKK